MARLVIGVPVYEGVDQIDVTAGWDVLGRLTRYYPKLNVELLLVGETGKPVTSGQKLIFTPTYSFKTCPKLDMLLVPGTQNLDDIVPNKNYINFLKQRGKRARYVVSVCTGAVLLAEAGLLDGHRATTHWAALDRLRGYANVTVANGYPRWVDCGNRMTTGGVSATIDGALHLVERLTGDPAVAKCIQLEIQYNPRAPYPGGDPATADFETYETVMG
ncbi:MAG: DJ-1/PfpI family protein, partial [Thermoanaerobaculia bacterium]